MDREYLIKSGQAEQIKSKKKIPSSFLQKELENKESAINNISNILGSYTDSEPAKQLHNSPLDAGSNLFYKEITIIRLKHRS